MMRTGASRSVALAVGWFALIGSGSAAWAQGPMTPGRPDVAPPPRVAPPPTVVPPPTPSAPVAPTATPRAPTITPTVVPPPPPTLPSAGAPGANRSAGSAPAGSTTDSIFDRWGNALVGVGVNSSGPNGPRTAVSDANGAVTLGRLSPGVHELTVSTRSVATASGGSQPAPRMLIGLLLPAVQKAREPVAVETAVQPNGGDLRIRIGVDAKGEVTSVDWGNGKGAIGTTVAVGDINGDGRAEVATGRRQYQPLLARARDQTHIVFGAGTTTGASTIGTAPRRLSVGVKGKGPGGVFEMHTDGAGVARLGMLPVGTTDIELNGDALRSVGAPGSGTPAPQKLAPAVLIGVLATLKTGEPVVSVTTFPANAVPKSIKASLRVGRDGSLMEVNWGNGPQAPQSINGGIVNNTGGTYTQSGGTVTNAGTFNNAGAIGSNTATGTITNNGTISDRAAGATYTGSTTVNAGTLKILQDLARTAKPGDVMVFANSALQEVSTTR